MKAFHAYDIRGFYGVDFNESDVYKIGFFLPELLKTDKLLVGYDARISSPEVYKALTRGIIDAGCNVFSIGLATTPMVYYFTAYHGFDGSVMITASHNPKEHNGLKISGKNAMPVGYESGLADLELKITNQTVTPVKHKGEIIKLPVIDDYLDFQKEYQSDISSLKFAVDCSNGMSGLLVKQLFGDQPIYLNEKIDGSFPGHDPNPLNPKNLVQLQKSVKENKLDLGVIFDGDADRVMFVDEKGKFVSPDLIIALLGHYFLEKQQQTGKVLQDIRSSKAVGEYLSKLGGEISTWKVGRAYAAPKLKEIRGIYGGELAGHYYFKDFYYSDSAFMAAQIVLGLLNDFKKKGNSFSKIINQITAYHNSGEINFTVTDRNAAIEAVKNYFINQEKPLQFFDFDGYRLEYKDWWFNVRSSNTEPYLRFLAEATSESLLKSKLLEIRKIIAPFEKK